MVNGATMKLKHQVITPSQDTAVAFKFFRKTFNMSSKLTRITRTHFSAENYLWKVEKEAEGTIQSKFNMILSSKQSGTLFARDQNDTEVEGKWSLVPG